MEIDIFQLVLNVQGQRFIDRIDFDSDKKSDIWIDFQKDSEFIHPECEHLGCKAYDTTEKIWRVIKRYVDEAKELGNPSEISVVE